jgi:hypothetical protein
MLRALAKMWAKLSYVWQLEIEGSKSELNSKVAAQNAETSRKLALQLNAEADGIDKNIEAEEERLEKGYWECENGHEAAKCDLGLCDEHEAMQCDECKTGTKNCADCGKPMKLIKLSEMSGQEKYELDKQKKEAQGMVAEKRKMADQEVENVTNREQTAEMLAGNAENARSFADKIRAL